MAKRATLRRVTCKNSAASVEDISDLSMGASGLVSMVPPYLVKDNWMLRHMRHWRMRRPFELLGQYCRLNQKNDNIAQEQMKRGDVGDLDI